MFQGSKAKKHIVTTYKEYKKYDDMKSFAEGFDIVLQKYKDGLVFSEHFMIFCVNVCVLNIHFKNTPSFDHLTKTILDKCWGNKFYRASLWDDFRIALL